MRVQQIMNDLERGGGAGLGRTVEQGWVAEAAAALQYFLAMKLRKPLIPEYIQALALGTQISLTDRNFVSSSFSDESPGVSGDIIAHDILGLLRQDVRDRHEILLLSILDLLNCIVKYSPTDELRGCSVPITMLPIFFDMQAGVSILWKIAIYSLVFRRITCSNGEGSPWSSWKS